MKLTVAFTQGNDPEVHAEGCGDVKRGLRSRKYQGFEVIEAKEVEDGARWFWSDFLPGGCAYEESYYHPDAPEGERGMQDEDAQGYTKYLPCATQSGRATKKETEMPAAKTETKTAPATTPAQDAEAALLKGVTADPAPKTVKRGASAKAKTGQTEKTPAAKTPASPKTPQEKMLRPATKTVVGYVSWLKETLGAEAWKTLSADPERLAQVSLTNYGAYRAAK